MKKLLLLLLLVSQTAFAGLVTKPYTFSNNTIADATQVNADYDTLYTLVNGNLDNANILAGAGIVFSKLDSATVAGVSASQILTNKTLTAPVLGGSITGTYTLAGTPTLASPTISNPTFSGTATGTFTLLSPTITTPAISNPSITGTISGTPIITTPIIDSLYQDAAKTKLMTVPAVTSDTFALVNATQTLYNKTIDNPTFTGTYTLTSPTITGGTVDALTSLSTASGYNATINGRQFGGMSASAYSVSAGDSGHPSATTEVSNTSSGIGALFDITSGARNSAFGRSALAELTTGQSNSAFGNDAMAATHSGGWNSAFGEYSMRGLTTGRYNVAVGWSSLMQSLTPNGTGDSNTAIGPNACPSVVGGNSNTCLGSYAGSSSSPFEIINEDYRIVLGNNNITNAYIKVAWTVTSDARDKADIADSTLGLNYLMKLRPVTFKWDDRSKYWETKEDGTVVKHSRTGAKKDTKTNIGFLAQDVLHIEQTLGVPNDIVVDAEQPDNLKIKDTAMIPILVKAVQEQQTLIKDLEARLSILEAK